MVATVFSCIIYNKLPVMIIQKLDCLYYKPRIRNKYSKYKMEQILSAHFVRGQGVRRRCGCYPRRPSAIGLSFQNTLVPLQHIDYQLEIVNSLLNITVTQTYINPIDKYLQVEYSMPIVPQCSIYKFIAQFNDVKIEGVVKEKGQARKDFEKAKGEGRQAALGNVDQSNQNMLNLQIGNIPPKTEFVITICFLQEIKVSLNTLYRVQIPSSISPHCMKGTQRQTKIQQKEESNRKNYTWNFKIDLKTSRKLVFFNSPSHKLTLMNQNQQGTQTLLVMANSQIPNNDFTFTYTTEDFHLPCSVLGATDVSATVMISFIPKFCKLDVTDAYKAFVQNQPYQFDISTVKGDYVFFLDRSHSMGGKRMAKAKQALIFFLKSLPEDSYFNVISFGSTASRMFPSSQKNNSATIRGAIEMIQEMKANMGGTWIYTSLFQLLRQKVIDGYPRQVFLLSDGGVENTQQVINMVSMNTNYSRVHTIGIGDKVSYDLIQGCAEAGRGKFAIITDNQNPAEKIVKLLEDSLTPLISNVKLNCSDEEQIQSIIPNPKSVPYILKDEIANFFVTFKGPILGKKLFNFEYEDYFTKLPYTSVIQVDETTFNLPFVDKMAHLKVLKCLELSAENNVHPDSRMFYPIISKLVEQTVDYSIKHQILSKFTSFVCIGNQLVDHQYQQFKTVGNQKIKVENLIQSKKSLTKARSRAKASKEPLKTLKKKQKLTFPVSLSKPIQPMPYRKAHSNIFSKQISAQSQQFHSMQMNNQIQFSNYALNERMDEMEENFNMSYNQSQDYEYEESRPKKRVKLQKNIEEKIVKEGKKSQRKRSDDQSEKSTIDVKKIIFQQQANGSWTNINIIVQIGKNVQVIKSLLQTIKLEVVVTKLVLLWLQKHYKEMQFELIIKKAIAWLARATISKCDQDKLNSIECK